MKEMFITVAGFRNYSGAAPFRIGRLVRCAKEPDNAYDKEAIRCTMPMLGTVGYVANSWGTVAGGTMSAGRVYDRVGKRFYARVLFTTGSKIICRVEEGDPAALRGELLSQIDDDWKDDDDEDEDEDDKIETDADEIETGEDETGEKTEVPGLPSSDEL